MWFRNLQMLRVESVLPTADALSEALAARPFTGCGRLEREHAGFVPPYGGGHLAHAAGYALWFALQIEEKLLPARIVADALNVRIAEIEAKEARRVGRKEKQTLKEQVTDELLPQAFIDRRKVHAVFIGNWLLIDAASLAVAERVVSLLLQCLPDLKLSRPDAERSPASRMADLLLSAEQDGEPFQLDSACVLHGPGTPQGRARFAQLNLQQPEIVAHLAAGMRPAQLGMLWRDRVAFTLREDWQVKGVKFLDLVQDQVTESDAADQQALIDATLTIQAAELRELLADLMAWLDEGGVA